jgi:hypothetical protein
LIINVDPRSKSGRKVIHAELKQAGLECLVGSGIAEGGPYKGFLFGIGNGVTLVRYSGFWEIRGLDERCRGMISPGNNPLRRLGNEVTAWYQDQFMELAQIVSRLLLPNRSTGQAMQ